MGVRVLSLFEFILVMVSLVLAIALTQLLEGVTRVARQRSRFELSWATSLWAAFLFFITFNHWWSLWGMREANWTFPAFFYVLLPPTLLFVAVALLKPTEGREKVSLTEEFERVRVPFLSVMLLFVVLVTWDGYLLGTESAWNNLRLVQFVLLGLIVLALFSKRRAVQNLVAAAALTILIVASFVLRFLPAAFEGG